MKEFDKGLYVNVRWTRRYFSWLTRYEELEHQKHHKTGPPFLDWDREPTYSTGTSLKQRTRFQKTKSAEHQSTTLKSTVKPVEIH